MTATENSTNYKWVGTRPIRHDGFDKVVGKARFGADLDLPGQLHGAFVRSPHAHARIVSIDTSAAEAMPGVKAVVTGADFPALDPTHPNFDTAVNCMARGEVYYHGHAVAAVAATTKAEAKAAAAAVKVEYEALPAVLSIADSMAEGAPLANPNNYTKFAPPGDPSNLATITNLARGDVDQAMADADVVVEMSFDCAHVHQGYIEPHACVVDYGDGKANVWCSSQGHFRVRSMTADVLGLKIVEALDTYVHPTRPIMLAHLDACFVEASAASLAVAAAASSPPPSSAAAPAALEVKLATAPRLTKSELRKSKVAALRALLQARALSTVGKKAVLVQRLLADADADADAAAAADAAAMDVERPGGSSAAPASAAPAALTARGAA